MNKRIEHCLYWSGLTAQGCWDELDDYAKESIKKFAELLIRECAEVADIADKNECEWTGGNILTHFGVK